jgi:hypothetical protein
MTCVFTCFKHNFNEDTRVSIKYFEVCACFQVQNWGSHSLKAVLHPRYCVLAISNTLGNLVITLHKQNSCKISFATLTANAWHTRMMHLWIEMFNLESWEITSPVGNKNSQILSLMPRHIPHSHHFAMLISCSIQRNCDFHLSCIIHKNTWYFCITLWVQKAFWQNTEFTIYKVFVWTCMNMQKWNKVHTTCSENARMIGKTVKIKGL